MKILSNIWFRLEQRQAYCKQHLNICSLYSEALYEIQPLLCSLTLCHAEGYVFLIGTKALALFIVVMNLPLSAHTTYPPYFVII